MNIPNLLTGLRLLLVPVLVWSLYQEQLDWAVVIIIVAGVSDLLDGALARLLNQKTKLGSILDPAADKLIVAATYGTLALKGALPMWLFALVFTRDFFLAIGVLHLVRARKLHGLIRPKKSGKLAVGFQIIVGILVIANLYYGLDLPMRLLFLFCAVLTVVSATHYAYVFIRLQKSAPKTSSPIDT